MRSCGVVAIALAMAVCIPATACADILITPPVTETAVVTQAPTAPPVPSEIPRRVVEPLSASGWGAVATNLLGLFALTLGLTILIEGPVLAVIARGRRRVWRTAILVNAITNPIAVFAFLASEVVMYSIGIWDAVAVEFIVIELFVILAEWRLLKRALGLSQRQALIASVVANGLSMTAGVLLSGGF